MSGERPIVPPLSMAREGIPTATSATLRRCEQRDGTTFHADVRYPTRRLRRQGAPSGSGALTARPAAAGAASEMPVLSGRRRAESPPTRDMRRKRPPALSFLLRSGHRAARRARALAARARLRGVALAIFTALVLKAAVLSEVHRARVPSRRRAASSPFAYLVTALLFARSACTPSARSARADAHRRLALPGHVRRAALRARQRRTLLQLLPLLRLARLRAALRLRCCGCSTSAPPACCCAPPATAAARCSSARASTSAPSRTRSADAPHSPIEVVGFLSLTRCPPTGCARSARSRDLERVLAHERIDEVIIADPDFPQVEASSSSTAATSAACACASRRRRWRS